MHGVPPTATAVLPVLDPLRVQPFVLRLVVVPLLTLGAPQRNLFSRHVFLSLARPLPHPPPRAPLRARWRRSSYVSEFGFTLARSVPDNGVAEGESEVEFAVYSMISVTTPDPTVRPPSRIANLNWSSIAIGVINSTSICTLSPGITISTPSGSFAAPVTSVVRK